jgi:CRISPR-associated protein Csx10
LGQSKKDDYGRVHIEVLSPAPVSELPILENGQLTLWLLSDLLLRDQRLRPTADLDVLIQQLQTQLGVSLQLRHQAASDNNSLLSLMARQTRLESWQVRWGLPRPSLAGLAAGSCFVFEVNGNLDAAKLAQLEVTGIGERRAEGYGQVCFNDRLLTTPTSQLTARVNDVQALQSSAAKGLLNRETTEKLLKYARVIEEAAARQVIRQTALRIAANPDDRKNVLELNKDKPTMSQLGALRSIINRLQEPEQTEQTTSVMGWLQHLRQTPNRKDKWPPRSLQQIEDLVCNPETIWQLLRDPGMDIDPIRLTLIEHGDSALKRRLWAEAVQTLVDACIRTHKRGSENANQEGQ